MCNILKGDIMAFFDKFKRSALELTSIRCICLTAILIALDLVLKQFTIILPFTKISVAFIAISAIGMLYGPVVALLAGAVTDVVGYFITTQNYAFNPIFTIVEMTGGLIYGLFLYGMTTQKLDFSGGKAFFKSLGSNWQSVLRIVLAKFTVIVICNIFLNTWFQVIAGIIAPEAFLVKISARIGTSFIKMPFDVILMLLTLYPIKAAYNAVFKRIKNRRKEGI